MPTRPADISSSLSSQPSGTDDRFLSSVGMRVPPALGWGGRFRLPTGRKADPGSMLGGFSTLLFPAWQAPFSREATNFAAFAELRC